MSNGKSGWGVAKMVGEGVGGLFVGDGRVQETFFLAAGWCSLGLSGPSAAGRQPRAV